MQYTKLKKTNLNISRIGLGTNAVGGHNLFDNLNEEDGKNFVRAAIDEGITFIDTADIYGKGRSEELVGEVIKEKPRNEIVLATKGANEWFPDGSVVKNNNPSYLRKAFENSLKRLDTDYVDLYYIHFPDGKTRVSDAVAELVKLKEEGKIRAIGVSNMSIDQLKEANAHGDIHALQMAYHMFDRSVEKDVLPYCIEHDISFVPYGPLAFGLLGGYYTKDFTLPANDWRNSVPLFAKGEFEKNLTKVELLKEFAAKKSTTISHLALAWLLAQDGVDSVIPGGKRPEQIRDTAKAAGVLLHDEDLKKIDEILG
ncbi:aldo/keto reductase [Domibacillus epiphyticus]|uniref:Oxidoreductase n=1 Tax=Domibacillus epiphyticus TaxID=1714355 RepID=A0A1V2A5D2_9BACI|nr:aldo/keto reductase [Domibacillus epiphyticus]OMP66014.1 oxidoreductase [Domibacillus epiphyticus]